MTLRAVIVDDEPLAREGLAHDVAQCESPRVEIVGQAANARAALGVIRRELPDILFLDIEMPEMNGFDMLAELEPEEMPAALIVVTAYNEHALRGFDANALDFLLKPYTVPRLQTALTRAAARVIEARAARTALDAEAARALASGEVGSSGASAGDAPRYIERLLVTERERTIVLPVRDIEWIEAQSYYARLHVPPKSWLLRERMSALAASLDPDVFFRAHRSTIVQLAHVREILAVSRYEHEVVLSSGARAPLARARRAALDEAVSRRR